MYLFETSWMQDFKYFERVFDTNLKKSIVRQINGKTEYFTPSNNGLYTCLIDDGLKYSKQLGNAKDAMDKHGVCKPIYRNIRDNYWQNGNINKNPRIWFIDIETRSGRLFLHKIPKSKENIQVYIKDKNTNDIKTIKFKDIQNPAVVSNENQYLFSYDNIEFSELKNMSFMEKTVAFPDVEKAQHEIVLIQIYDNIENKIFVLGLKDFDLKKLNELGYKLDADVKYVNCQNEIKLLTIFIQIFKKLDPLILFAWNGLGFDFVYLHNRIKNLGLPFVMSNYGEPELNNTKNDKGQIIYKYNSPGHIFLDFMDVYKKFTFTPQSSYSLDNIAKFELNDNKVPHDEFTTFDSFYTGSDYQYSDIPYEDKLRELIRTSYKSNKDLFKYYVNLQFIYYGIYDVVLLKKIDNKLKLSNLMLAIATKMGVLVSDTLRTVTPWSQYISNTAYLNNQIMPKRTEHDKPKITGGFVREPIKGKHKWNMNLDVDSMYPNLSITAFNMSPESYTPLSKAPNELKDLILSIVEDQNEGKFLDLNDDRKKYLNSMLKKYNYSLGINGALFKQNEVGIIPRLVTDIYGQRKNYKKQMLNYQKMQSLIKEVLHKRKVI